MKRIIPLFIFMLLLAPSVVFAHSGGTDSNGGHHDYNNVSGLGDYHYHHGFGPHLHEDGVCPYTTINEITFDADDIDFGGINHEEDTYTMTESELQDYIYDQLQEDPYFYEVVPQSDYIELKEENQRLKKTLESKKWNIYDYGLVALIVVSVAFGYYKLYQWGKEKRTD